MKRFSFVCLVLFGTTTGLLGPAGTAHPASPETRARAALALVQATARVKAAAAAESPPAPARAVKQCPCSNFCTCGCVQGRPCTCSPAVPASVVRPDLPTFSAPAIVPVRRSGGGC